MLPRTYPPFSWLLARGLAAGLALAPVLSFAACSSSSSGGADGLSLRPSVVKVYAGREYVNPGCTGYSASDCPGWEDVVMVDVEVVPPHVRLLRVDSVIEQGWIDWSDDMGKTWNDVEIKADLQYLPIDWQDAGPLGVHYENGKTYLLATWLVDAQQGDLHAFEIDLATGTPTMLPHGGIVHPPPGPSVRMPNGHLRWTEQGAIVDYDVATDDWQYVPHFYCGDECYHADFLSNDGTGFDGYGRGTFKDPQAANPIDTFCRVHLREDGEILDLCMPGSASPIPFQDFRGNLLIQGDDAYKLWNDAQGNAYATALLPSVGTTPPRVKHVAIGHGAFDAGPPWGLFYRRRFGPFGFLWDDVDNSAYRQGHLVELTPGGAHRVLFDVTPCTADAATCGNQGYEDWGYGEVQWIEPTGEGDYFVFYDVQSSSDGNQETLYVDRQTPTFEDYPQTNIPAPPDTSAWSFPFPDAVEATPAAPLERQCIVYASCVGGDPAKAYRDCIAHFTTTPNYLIQSRARFLAAPATCDGMKSVWPEAFGLSSGCPLACYETGGTCDSSGQCTTGIGPASGATCGSCLPGGLGGGEYVVCAGGNGFAATCTGSGTCVANVGCAQSFCGGDVCHEDANGGNYQTCIDKVLYNHECSAITPNTDCIGGDGTKPARCGSKGECDPKAYAPTCSTIAPSMIAVCSEGAIAYADCKALGFTSCVNGACK